MPLLPAPPSELVPAVGTVTGMLINVVQRTQTSVKWNTSQYIKKKKKIKNTLKSAMVIFIFYWKVNPTVSFCDLI